jgi:putative ABC transport system permease protein
MNLASKDIRHNAGRFALTTLGVGMLLMIVMGMSGIYRGIVEDAVLLVDKVGADVWVVQRNTRGPFAEISRVPQTLVYRVEAVPGVKKAREFVYHTIQREHRGRPLRIAILGLAWPTDKGEWIPLVAGRPLASNHYEMIADVSLGLDLGEHIKLGKNTYTVVGLTSNMMSASGDGLAFFTVSDALAIQFDMPGEAVRLERAAREARGQKSSIGSKQPALLDMAKLPSKEIPAIAPPQLSAVMATLEPGADPDQVAQIISGWDDVSVFTGNGQKELLLTGSVEKVRKQIGLFRILLTIIAAIIMALILYTLTLDKIHTIALLKLIGAPNIKILGLILQEALFIGVLGFGIAYLLGSKIFPNFPRRVIITPEDLVQLGLIVLAISILSSFLGIWKALKVSANEALS